jgi:Tfp pilus assembly protein PilN
MAKISAKGKPVVGLFLDGLDLKFVILDVVKDRVRVKGFKTVQLGAKLEQTQYLASDLDEFSLGTPETSSFDLDDSEFKSEVSETDSIFAESNEAIIRNLLSDLTPGKYSIAYAVTEPAVDYQILETDFGLKGKKLKTRVLEELGRVRSSIPDPESLSVLETSTGSIICIIREDGIGLANLINDAMAVQGKRPPKISVIDTAEVALMNAVRMNYQFESDEHTLLVYVAQEFTRLIFMRGNEYQHFAPVIAEDIDSGNLQNTIYSRASLEQHNLGIHHLDRIILAGDASRIQLGDFLNDRFALTDISYLTFDKLDTSFVPGNKAEQLPEYAIPIAAAWKVIDSENPAMYPVNVIPSSITVQHNIFRLSWHGYLLLLLLFLVTVFFAAQIPIKQRTISHLTQEIVFKETQVLEVDNLESSITHIQNEINKLDSALRLYEQLVPGYNRWSRYLTHLSTGVEDLNSLWILDVRAVGDEGRGLEINGYSIFRSRIPRFANLFDNAVLQEVLVQEIRGRIVYRFKIIVENAGE